MHKVGDEDNYVQVKLFILYLAFGIQHWVTSCCKTKGISYLTHLISGFLEFYKPQCTTYVDILRDLIVALKKEVLRTSYKIP
jgi:hypothetical protein